MTSNYKNSMYPRSFLCKEAKIKQRTPLKKELCEIGEEAIWESRFTSFFPVLGWRSELETGFHDSIRYKKVRFNKLKIPTKFGVVPLSFHQNQNKGIISTVTRLVYNLEWNFQLLTVKLISASRSKIFDALYGHFVVLNCWFNFSRNR